MKFINKYKSPNYDSRKTYKIKFIIVHYTALNNVKEAIKYLCDPSKKVSCHYLISKNGDIYNLVNDEKRAWHAGISFWDNSSDLNSSSLGIELDYSSKLANQKYSDSIIKSLIYLIKFLQTKYKVENTKILGHSDIAPLRKIDPGRNFPWTNKRLKKLTFYPKINKNIKPLTIISWFKKNGLKNNKEISIFILSYIGYSTDESNNSFKSFKKVISAYQSHYLQKNITGKVDNETIKFMIYHLLDLLLTKKKIKIKRKKMVR